MARSAGRRRRVSAPTGRALAVAMGLGISLGVSLGIALGLGAAVPAAGTPRSNSAEQRAVPPVDYVALGDSYSAGPLVPAQRPDPVNCLRSTNNYPAYLAGYLGVRTYRDVTCSGARVRDFTHVQTTVIPGAYNPSPQVQALSAGTDVVTVGIGGNDYGLFGSLTGTCPTVAAQDPTGAPCTAYFTNSRGVNTEYRDARRIQRHVGRGIAQIRAAAPHASVYVVGYPRLLPRSGTCATVGFARGDYPFARRVEYLLNRSVRRAATAHGATYIGTYRASLGHDACAGRDAWINGKHLLLTRAAAYHPFQVGERGLARAVFHAITRRVAPDGGDASPPLGSVVCNPTPKGVPVPCT